MEYFGKNKIVAEIKTFIESKIENRKDLLKIVAIPALVIAAVLFFWLNTNDNAIEVEDNTAGAIAEENHASDESGMQATGGTIYVDIGGEVLKPGVYEVDEGTRLFEVIEKAGGLTENANVDDINRAEEVFDGQKILIGNDNENNGEGNIPATQSSAENDGKVNINTATSAELQTIPGIGPSKADRIIQYRESEGKFKSIDDIKKISGIGNKTFESIREYITV